MSMAGAQTVGRNRLGKYLAEGELLTSSELASKLTSDGYSGVNARKLISRYANTNGIWRSEKVRLAKDERLFAHKKRLGTERFLRIVGEKLAETSRQGLARCIQSLVDVLVLNRISVLRLLAVHARPPLSDLPAMAEDYGGELSGMEELGVRAVRRGTPLESIVVPGISESGDLDWLTNLAAQGLRHQVLLTRILVDRFRRENMLAWNHAELPQLDNPYTVFNGHVFSAFGFSYLSPLQRFKEAESKPTPCPVLIDCYDGECSLPQVASFLQRIERATFRAKRRLQALTIIAAADFTNEAWTFSRSRGLMTINFRQIFGDTALDAMAQVESLINSLRNKTVDEAERHFEQMEKLFDDLKTNPIITDLRSIAFEALSALILRCQGFEGVELGRIVPYAKSSRDVDVFGICGDELRIIECKAYSRKRSISGGEVEKFFTETVPALKHWLRATNRHFSRCNASIWTTGPRGKEAGDTLYKLQRPEGDVWDIIRMSDQYDQIPKTIRQRSVKLLEAIAFSKT